MKWPTISQLAPPGVSFLISFLAYGSQVFFRYIEPYELTKNQTIAFNVLVACTWICYARACLTDPGRVPTGWNQNGTDDRLEKEAVDGVVDSRKRWCRKCEAFKPPRAHHCKTCKRCIPKMDHHCPWTVNCVSHRTFPHFMRFLFYAVASMSYLQYFLYLRAVVVWNDRNLPSYLGPSPAELISLFVMFMLNSLTWFALFILLVRSLWSLFLNITTIESWEIERHQTLLRRAKTFGGFLDAPNGTKVRIIKQEFPYDIGLWANVCQGMGGGFLTWLWPFSKTPSRTSGLSYETNGFEDHSVTWPPPDPDRMSGHVRSFAPDQAFTYTDDSISNQEQIRAFRERQESDLKRLRRTEPSFTQRRPFHERFQRQETEGDKDLIITPSKDIRYSGEEAWRNSEGERLADFGLDEDTEFYDEDNIPLAHLLQRRQSTNSRLRP